MTATSTMATEGKILQFIEDPRKPQKILLLENFYTLNEHCVHGDIDFLMLFSCVHM